jgi:hypothetical protein
LHIFLQNPCHHVISSIDEVEILTQLPLAHFSGRENDDRKHFGHYFNDGLRQRGSWLDLRINLESAGEVFDAFKEIDKAIVAVSHVLGRLAEADITTD